MAFLKIKMWLEMIDVVLKGATMGNGETFARYPISWITLRNTWNELYFKSANISTNLAISLREINNRPDQMSGGDEYQFATAKALSVEFARLGEDINRFSLELRKLFEKELARYSQEIDDLKLRIDALQEDIDKDAGNILYKVRKLFPGPKEMEIVQERIDKERNSIMEHEPLIKLMPFFVYTGTISGYKILAHTYGILTLDPVGKVETKVQEQEELRRQIAQLNNSLQVAPLEFHKNDFHDISNLLMDFSHIWSMVSEDFNAVSRDLQRMRKLGISSSILFQKQIKKYDVLGKVFKP